MKAFPDVPFLRGNYGPWLMEGEARDLVVEGEIPRELCGTLYRNGPNPQFPPRGAYHWFDGDGMLHAFSLENGRASYRNRWVRTPKFELERRHGESLMGGLMDIANRDPRAEDTSINIGNTSAVVHGNKLLALCEAGEPFHVDGTSLATVGPYTFDSRLEGAMTAHPKVDPATGEMLFFGYGPFPPFLRYHVADATGALIRSEEIDVPAPTMMHDFIVTENHVVFMVCPLTFRAENFQDGQPVKWEPELGTQLGVMPRNGGNADVVWLQTDPCYVFHPMNAYEDDGRIVADVCRYARGPLFDGDVSGDGLEEATSAFLTRWILDPVGGTVKEERLDERPAEFPRVDERRAGRRYRYGYAAARPDAQPGSAFDRVIRYDLEGGASQVHEMGPAATTSEPVFVPLASSGAEDAGVVLAVVHRAATDRSELLVLDAQRVDGEPLARVQLPHRVPNGFHGCWGDGVLLGF